MSAPMLSEDSIAALFDAAKEGRLEEAQAAANTRKRRVRAVDFNRPKKFSPEQERLLRRTVEDFARAASSRLSAEVRVPLELEVLSASQLVWTDAHARVNGDAISVPITVRPSERQALLSIDLELMLRTIDLLTGGDDNGRTRTRRLTDIDLVLGELLVSRLVAQLAPVWADVLGFELEAGNLQAHLDTAQLAQVSEPTCAIVMEARLGTASATVTLSVPWSVFAPAAERMDSGGDAATTVDPRVVDAIGGAQVLLRGEVGRTRLVVSDVLDLKPGDVLTLGGRVADGVAITVDGVPVHRARPGTRNGRLAVQLS